LLFLFFFFSASFFLDSLSPFLFLLALAPLHLSPFQLPLEECGEPIEPEENRHGGETRRASQRNCCLAQGAHSPAAARGREARARDSHHAQPSSSIVSRCALPARCVGRGCLSQWSGLGLGIRRIRRAKREDRGRAVAHTVDKGGLVCVIVCLARVPSFPLPLFPPSPPPCPSPVRPLRHVDSPLETIRRLVCGGTRRIREGTPRGACGPRRNSRFTRMADAGNQSDWQT
jgi:hypothetical protein